MSPVGSAKPQAEERARCPAALAELRHAFLDVGQRRVVRRDTAVDDADDDALAAELEVRPQAAHLVFEPEKDRAVVGRQMQLFVGPNTLHCVVSRKLRYLRGRELGGESVQGIAKAVDLGVLSTDLCQEPVVRELELLGVGLYGGRMGVEPLAGRRLGRTESNAPLVARGTRVLELDDVNAGAALGRLHRRRELQPFRDRHECRLRAGHGRAQHRADREHRRQSLNAPHYSTDRQFPGPWADTLSQGRQGDPAPGGPQLLRNSRPVRPSLIGVGLSSPPSPPTRR